MEKEYDIKQIFQEIEDRLISSMKRNLYTHKQDEKLEGFDWGQWQAHKLKSMQKFREENKEIFEEYSDVINRYSYKTIKSQFKEGASKVNKEAIKNGFINKEDSKLGGSFFKMNERKVDSLINVVKDDMKDVRTATLRFMNDTYRSTIYKAQIFAGTGAGTLQQAIDMATHDFLKKGINCIEYKDGRRVNIADYCDMAVKTAQTRATLMGEGALRKGLGISTVYVTKHGTSCEKCSKWQGRVYIDDVWSGGTEKDGKYPLLSTAIAGGLYHPRCKHGISTYFEDINEEPEEIKENEHNHNDEYIQELNRRKREYERLALGSFDALEYKNRINELQKEIENSTITEDENYAMNKYISSDFYTINEKLRNDIDLNKTEKALCNNLEKILDKMDNYDGLVTRSLHLDNKELNSFLKEHKIDKIVNYKAFTSTTKGERYSNKSNVELYIDSKFGKNITQFNFKEQEILYKRNSKFKVKVVEKIKDTYHILLEDLNGR